MTHTNCQVIGITGGIATGKSTVLNIIRNKGYIVIDADKIAKNLMKKDEINYKNIVGYFGEGILGEDGEIDRKILGSRVFSNPKLLKILNNLTHPNIFMQIKDEIKKHCKNNKIFVDIPLLFEEYDNVLRHDIKLNEIWLISTDKDTQLKRLMERNHFTKEEAMDRIEAQMPLCVKEKRSDKIICNSRTIDDLKKEIEHLLEHL